MNPTQRILTLSALVASAVFLNAQISWDGGAGNSQWNATTAPENWSGDVAPTVTDNVIVDANTNLRAAGNWILDITGAATAQNLTLDPVWSGTTAGKIGVRGDSALNIANNGAITITSNYTDGTSPTFGNSTGGNLFLRSAVNGGTLNFVNNSATEVSFEGGAGGNVVQLRGQGGNETTTFGGTGNFLLSTDVTVFILERIWTSDTFSGALTLNGDTDFMAPTTDLRINGGTLKIGTNEQIGDATQLSFGGTSATMLLDARGITETAGVLSDFTGAGAAPTILLDASSTLTFADLRAGVGAVGIDLSGWVEGSSALRFTDLGGTFYSGTVDELAVIEGLTIEGGTAHMRRIPDINGDLIDDWEITSILVVDGTLTLTGNDLIEDDEDLFFNGGTLETGGFNDTVGTARLLDDSTIDLTGGGGLEFADSSGADWNGYLTVTGELGAGSLRFGTDATGLSASQLARIRHGGATVFLDENGYLRRIDLVTSHNYVGGPSDFGYTRVIEDFDWGSVPSPSMSGGVSLSDNGDGSGAFTITAFATDPQINFYNSPYAFDPYAFPYLRMRYRSGYDDNLNFWPSPANPINLKTLALTQSGAFNELSARFTSLALTDPVDVSVTNPVDSNGVRIDPLPSGTGSAVTYELDYLLVDSFPTMALDEFNRAELQWTAANLDAVGIQSTERLTGAAGAASTTRSMTKAVDIAPGQYNALEIRVRRESGSTGPMRLRWDAADIGEFTLAWTPESDGSDYSYMIDLSAVDEWSANTITQITVDLFDASEANAGKTFEIDFIRLRQLPEIGGGIIHDFVNFGELFNLRYEPQYDYVLSKLRKFRSVAGQAEGVGSGWRDKVSASAMRHHFEVVIDGRQPWWKEQDASGGFEWVVRDGNGDISVEAAAEAFFQEIKTIAAALETNDPTTNKRLRAIYPDNALAELIFPNQNPLSGLQSDKLRGGFYEVAADAAFDPNTFDPVHIPAAQALAVDCFVRMMEKLRADPVTRNVEVFCFNATHVWEWDGIERDFTAQPGNAGNLREILDTLLQQDALAFPDGDSPLVGFAQDTPWQFYRGPQRSRKKLQEYIEYAQTRGYRFTLTANGEHFTDGEPDDGTPRSAYEASWRYIRRMIADGGRPVEIHPYEWSGEYQTEIWENSILSEDDGDGTYATPAHTLEDDPATDKYTYAATLRRCYDRMHYGLPPTRPEIVSAAYSGADIVVRWRPNPEFDLLGYYVERASEAAGPFTRLTASPVSGETYTDTSAAVSTLYFYRVVAVDSVLDESPKATPAFESLPSFPVRNHAPSAVFVLAADDFDDQSNPGWFGEGFDPIAVADPDDDNDGVGLGDHALFTDYQSNGTGANWLRYFRPSGSPVTLYDGDRLSVEWQAKQTAFNTSGSPNFIRFGLFDSNGVRITTHSALDAPEFGGYDGYLINSNNTVDTSFPYTHALLLRREGSGNQLSATSDYTGIQGVFDMIAMEANEWTPPQRLSMERTSDGWQVESALGGSIRSGSTTAAYTTIRKVVENSAQSRFDTFYLRYRSGEDVPGAFDFLIDNFKVTLERAPGRVLPADFDSATTIAVEFGQYLDLVEGNADIGGLSGQGEVKLDGRTLAVGSNDASTTFSGTLSGDGTFVKEGTGTLTLDGDASGHSGTVRATGGTLRLAGGVAIGDGASLVLESGATLETQGLAESAGTLQVAGNAVLDLANGVGTFDFADSSGINWSGTLTITGSLSSHSLRFGAGGLTPAQLALIAYDGGPVSLNADGYLQTPATFNAGTPPTHISWTRSGGDADSPWTRILENFGWTSAPTPVLENGLTLTDNGDGTGRLTVKKSPSNYAATFSGGSYAFAPEDFPFLRLRFSTPAADSLIFGPLPDWEDPSLPTTSQSLDYTASAGLAEVYGRFADVPTHVQQGRYTDAGFRIDPVAASPNPQRDLDIDYIAVDAHPVLAIDEFDRTPLDPAWTSGQLDGLSVASGLLSGSAGTGGARSLSRPVAVDGEYWNMLEIRLAREAGAMHGFAFAWKDDSNEWHQVEILPLADDGQFHYYQIDLAKCPEWYSGAVTEIRLDPYSSDPANDGLAFQLDYLRLRHMPVMGLGEQNWTLNLSAETHVAKWNTGNALARYASTSLAIWNNPGGDHALRGNWARLAKERNLRLTCTIPAARFFEGPADYDGDGFDEYRIPQDGNGDPSPQLAADLAFAEIRQLALDMAAVGYDEMYIGFDGLLRYLMFPTYRLDQDDTSGGYYEAAGNSINQTVYDQCAETVIRLMELCAADPATQNFRFRIYPNLHMWEWEGMARDITRDIVSSGDFRPLVDAVHAANTAAFPAGNSPLIIFDTDYPEDFVRFGNLCRKLIRYQEYVQNLGYLAMCNAVETYDTTAYGSTPGIASRQGAHAAAVNFVEQIAAYGGRPDIINSSWWQDHWQGTFDTAAVTEEETTDSTLTSLWPKLMDRFTADTASRIFNESLPEFNNSGTPGLLVLADGTEGNPYAGSLAAEAEDPDPSDELGFEKLSGPAWLQVAADGSLSGTPIGSDFGTNSFRVSVNDGRGGIDESDLEITVSTPASPSDLTASSVSKSRIDLSWTDNSGAESGYRILRATSSQGPWSQLHTVTTDSTSYQNIGLGPEETYFFRVLATSPLNDSTTSNEASATTLSLTEDWRMIHFGTAENTGAAADSFDYDDDGSNNQLERAFGTIPTQSGSVFNPSITLTSIDATIYPTITYRRLSGGSGTTGVDYTANGMTYTVEYDTDLIPEWGTGAVTEVGAPVTIDSEVEEVTVRYNLPIDSGNTRHFLRLRVSSP